MEKHAVIVTEKDAAGNTAAATLTPDRTVLLAEREYSPEERETFRAEAPGWILECSGRRFFLADSDSGEDAKGSYRGYFGLIPEKAIFQDGRFAGVYLCSGGLRYSGRSRSDFLITDWGFPGNDPFVFVPWGGETHVFLFADEQTHVWKDWRLLKREPGKEYISFLEF